MGLFAQIKKGEKRMLQNTSAGLSEAEAKARLAQVGDNRLRGKKGASVAAMFFSQFKDLMLLILAAATLISVLMGEGTEAITIIIIVLKMCIRDRLKAGLFCFLDALGFGTCSRLSCAAMREAPQPERYSA